MEYAYKIVDRFNSQKVFFGSETQYSKDELCAIFYDDLMQEVYNKNMDKVKQIIAFALIELQMRLE